jgi:hypothetical protein
MVSHKDILNKAVEIIYESDFTSPSQLLIKLDRWVCINKAQDNYDPDLIISELVKSKKVRVSHNNGI